MKNALKAIGLLVGLALTLRVMYFYYHPVMVYSTMVNYDYVTTLDQLVEKSDMVAIVKTTQPYRQRKQNSTPVIIEHLLQTKDTSIQPNRVISLGEGLAFQGKKMHLATNYTPLQPHESYLVFLRKYPSEHHYYVVNANDGKFILTGVEDNARRAFPELEIAVRQHFQEAIQRFLNQTH